MDWQRLSAEKRSAYTLPAALIIMDGYGLAAPSDGNAISLASTPCLDDVFATCSHTQLQASGEAVGLPAGQMGNSEVGHLNIGAGRVVHQELSRISRACKDGSLATNDVLNTVFNDAVECGGAVHFMGLLSNGGVHSSNSHLYSLISAAKNAGVENVYIHAFMDGRDVPPTSGITFVEELQTELDKLCSESFSACIASLGGRYYGMDRDNRWERIAIAWESIVRASPLSESNPSEYISQSYEQGTTDEFIIPTAFCERGIKSGDAVVFFNFRPDRARQISRVFVCDDATLRAHGVEEDYIVRFGKRPCVSFACLTEYDPDIPAPVVFPKQFPQNVLADVLASEGLLQYHIAETEKYAHVTFFLNGGLEEPKAGEVRKLIPSPKVATYDLQPEMSEPEVAQTLAAAIESDEADVYIVNFANCDMVGHTGVIPAAVKAVEAVDAGVKQVLAALKHKGGVALLTADHGNADKMIAEDGSPHTAHTTALVPLAFIDYSGSNRVLSEQEGALCNIAPTLLDAIGVAVPEEMEAMSLFE